MASAPTPSWFRRHKAITGILAVFALCLLLAVAARFWIKTDSGRAFVLSQINGQNISGYGTIEATGLSGDPLSSMNVSRIRIANETGVWLDAENLDLTWSPWAVTQRKIHLRNVTFDTVTISQKPSKSRPKAPSKPKPQNRTLAIDELRIARLHLLDGVAGPEATLEAYGKLLTGADNTFDIGLTLSPTDNTSDTLNVTLLRKTSGDIQLDATASAQADGTFAALLQLPAGQGATLNATISGTRLAGDGFARIQINDLNAANLTTNWADGELDTSAQIDATKLPLSSRLKELIGSSARINMSTTLRASAAPMSLSAELAGGSLSADGQLDSKTLRPTGPVQITASLPNADAFLGRAIALDIKGDLSGARFLKFDGTVLASPLAISGLPFKTLSGPISFDTHDQSAPFTANLVATELHAPTTILAKLASPSPNIVAQGVYEKQTGNVAFHKLTLNSPDGHVTVAGDVNTINQHVSLKGSLQQPTSILMQNALGYVSGDFTLLGTLNVPTVDFRLTGQNISSLPEHMQSLIGPSPRLSGKMEYKNRALDIQAAHFTADKLSADIQGAYHPGGPASLAVNAVQHGALQLNGNAVSFGKATAIISGHPNARRIKLNSDGGNITIGDHPLSHLSLKADLTQVKNKLSGQTQLTGQIDDQSASLKSDVVYTNKTLTLSGIKGEALGALISGGASLANSGAIDSTLTLTGNALSYAASKFGSVNLSAHLSKHPGTPTAFTATGEAQNISLFEGVKLDGLRGTASSTAQGLTFDLTAKRLAGEVSTNLSATGHVGLYTNAPEGTVTFSGTALGAPISTNHPIRWSTSPNRIIEADISLLGGTIAANYKATGTQPGIQFHASDLNLAPTAQHFGVPVSEATLNGSGHLNPFGKTPKGTFAFSLENTPTGIDTPLISEITGKLSPRALIIRANASAADLHFKLDTALPVTPSANGGIVTLSRQAALKARATLYGDLSALAPISLAYGHDIGGALDASATLTGTLLAPELRATASLSNGAYEHGRTGLRLTTINATSALSNGNGTISVDGRGAEGGTFKAVGTSTDSSIQIQSAFKALKVYDRDKDDLTASGALVYAQTDDSRGVSGDISLETAHFDITHLPSSRTKAIDVHWTTDGSRSTQAHQRRPVQLDLNIDAPNRLFVGGRGLTSEWGLAVAVSGDTETPQLSGAASLVRGDVALAGRPFAFDSGAIEFHGPLASATIALSAERSVNDFIARVGVSGSPQSPTLELSSTPDLPEDEILSRLLFGRSSIDLTPLQAAQVAASVSRIIGKSDGFAPSTQVQNALGVDRFSVGSSKSGKTEVGVGQYVAPNVYVELTSTIAEGSSIEVEWEPLPQVLVGSKTTTTGESKISIRWKTDY